MLDVCAACSVLRAAAKSNRLSSRPSWAAAVPSMTVSAWTCSSYDANTEVDILGARGIRFAQLLDRETDRPVRPADDATIKARLLLTNGSSMLYPTTMIHSTFIRENHLQQLGQALAADSRSYWPVCCARETRPKNPCANAPTNFNGRDWALTGWAGSAARCRHRLVWRY